MNFLKSSFFSDFKLQDVLALKQEDEPSSSQDAETLVSSDVETVASSDAKALASSDAETPASSDGETPGQQQEEAGIWNIGGLVKSITLKSEGILQAYRKDLEEFSSGLRKETKIMAEVAAHAVKDLPTSLETGASIAQESIESVGQVVEDFSSSVWRGTADIIAQGKDAVLGIEDDDDPPFTAVVASSSLTRYDKTPVPLSGGKYSRFEAQVMALQHDSSTYCDEPDDLADYTSWKSAFSLPEKKQDIDSLLGDNTFLKELFIRFVPEVVSEEAFWTRYFYQLHKLQQTEEARADLVKRASAPEEEDLSWDTEEEVEEGGAVHDAIALKGKSIDPSEEEVEEGGAVHGAIALKGKSIDPSEEGGAVHDEIAKAIDPCEEVVRHSQAEGTKPDNSGMETGKDVTTERSTRTQAKGNVDNKALVKATSEDEDDLGWEVAEDFEESSSNDGKRSSNSSWEVPEVPREDVRRRFSSQEQDEEDLSWDVDDGDDDAK